MTAGSAAQWRDFQRAEDRWLADLGPKAVAMVREAERTRGTDTPAYGAFFARSYGLHLCRLDLCRRGSSPRVRRSGDIRCTVI